MTTDFKLGSRIPQLKELADIRKYASFVESNKDALVRIQQRQREVLPSPVAKQKYGIDIPTGWEIEIWPAASGETPKYNLITGDQWKITPEGTFVNPKGEEYDYVGLSALPPLQMPEEYREELEAFADWRRSQPYYPYGEAQLVDGQWTWVPWSAEKMSKLSPETLAKIGYQQEISLGEYISQIPSELQYEPVPEDVLAEMEASFPGWTFPKNMTWAGLEGWISQQEAQAQRLPEAIGAVFPKDQVDNIMNWLSVEDEEEALANQNEFLDLVWKIGRTPETEELLRAMGATDYEVYRILGSAVSPSGEITKIPTLGSKEETAVLDPRILSGEIKIPEAGYVFDEVSAGGESFKAILMPDGTVRGFGRVIGKFDLTTGEYTDYSTQAIEAMPTLARVWGAGWGTVFSSVSGIFRRLGAIDQADTIESFANSLTAADAPANIYDTKYDDVRMVTEPGFWYGQLRSLPFLQAGLIVGGGIGAGAGGGIAGAVGATGVRSTIIQAIGYGVGRAIPESMMEAGLGYNDLLARGMSREDANEAFDRIFAKNLGTLTATDTLEFLFAFSGVRVPGGKALSLIGKIAGGALSEGTEEILQEIYQRQESGVPITWDKSMTQQFLAGAVLGGLFTVGGNIMQQITDKTYTELSPELKEKFDNTKSAFIRQGIDEQQANIQALEEIAKTPEGKEAIQKATTKVKKAEIKQRVEAGLGEISAEDIFYRAATEGQLPLDEGTLGKGEYWSSSREYALTYGETLQEARIDTSNFLKINTQAEWDEFSGRIRSIRDQAAREGNDEDWVQQTLRNQLEAEGYNGVYVAPGIIEVGAQVVVFYPRKSVFRTGVPPTKISQAAKTSFERTQSRLNQVRQQYQQKIKNMADTKQALYDFVRGTPLQVRGKMLAQMKNIQSESDLTKAFDMAARETELYAQRTLRTQILKELKETAPAKVKGVLKGKYTAEVQDKLNAINANIKGDRDAARSRIAENISAYEGGKLSHQDMVESNELLDFVGIQEMSSYELQHTLDNIKSLKDIGRTLREAQQQEYFTKIENLRTEAERVLTGDKGLKPGTASVAAAELEAKVGKAEILVNRQYAWDNLLDKLSKFDKASKPYQSAISQLGQEAHLARNMERAGEEIAFQKIQNKIKEIFGVKTRRQMNDLLNRMQNEKIDLGTYHNLDGDPIHLELTKNQIIKKYQEIQDPTLEETFRDGMRWSFSIQQAIVRNLTAEEKAWADWQLEFYQDYYDTINEVYREVYGVNLPHNPNYSPIGRDVDSVIPENVLVHKDMSRYASVLNGSLKSRVRNRIPLRFNDATEVLVRHITQMEHFKAWAHAMMDFRRVFGNKTVRTAIIQYHGKDILNLVDNYMNDFARGGINKALVNRGFDLLRKNFTRAILGLKPAISLKQIPSVLAFSTEMGMGDFISGVADFWTNPVAHYKFMMENSPYMRARFSKGFERDIKFAMGRTTAKQITSTGNVTDWFMTLIRMGDKFAVTQGMWAKYRAELKAGKTQAEAMALAEQATKRTQPTSEIETLSAWQRGGSFMKLLTMFQNQPNKYFRIIGDNFRNLVHRRGSQTKAVANIITAWVILPALFQLIADGFRWRKEHQLRAWVLGPINHLLIVGQLGQTIYNWITGETWDYEGSPILSTFNDLQVAIQKLMKLIKTNQDPFKQITPDALISTIEYFAKFAGELGGVPTPYFIMVERALRSGNYWELIFSRWVLQQGEKEITDPRVTAITDKYKELFAKYDGASDPDSIFYIEDKDERKDFRDKLLDDNPEFADAKRELEALDLGVPDNLVPDYVEYYSLPEAGYERERFLKENQPYYNDVWLGIQGNNPVDFDSVPSEEVENLLNEYNELPLGKDRLVFRHEHPELEEWGLSTGKWKSPVGDRWQTGEETEEEKAEVPSATTAPSEEGGEVGEVPKTPSAEEPEQTVVEKYSKEIAAYKKIPKAGYGNERFLQENPDFYNDIWLGEWGNQPIDFDRIPSKEVEYLLNKYDAMPAGNNRLKLRCQNEDLDDFLVNVRGLKPCYGTSRCTGMPEDTGETPEGWEEWGESEAIRKWIEGIIPQAAAGSSFTAGELLMKGKFTDYQGGNLQPFGLLSEFAFNAEIKKVLDDTDYTLLSDIEGIDIEDRREGTYKARLLLFKGPENMIYAMWRDINTGRTFSIELTPKYPVTTPEGESLPQVVI
jgi:hypothetical protein